MKDENWVLIAAIAILVILYLGPQVGLFAVEEIIECPDWAIDQPSPCEGSVWIGVPHCTYDITGCEDYCDSDEDCVIWVEAQNDCSLFWKPHKVLQTGYCEYKFCKWTEIPEQLEPCTGSEIFLQRYKYIIAVLMTFIVAFLIFEKDYGKGKRGFL